MYILGITIIFVAGCIYYVFGIADSNYEANKWKEATGEKHITYQNYYKHSLLKKLIYPKIFVTVVILTAVFPSKDTLKWMAGAYVTAESIEYLSSNEAAKQLPNNVLEVANTFLEDLKTVDLNEVVKDVKKETVSIKKELVSEVKELTKEQKEELIKKLNE